MPETDQTSAERVYAEIMALEFPADGYLVCTGEEGFRRGWYAGSSAAAELARKAVGENATLRAENAALQSEATALKDYARSKEFAMGELEKKFAGLRAERDGLRETIRGLDLTFTVRERDMWIEKIKAVSDENTALREAVEGAKKDAARYRWIKREGDETGLFFQGIGHVRPDELDAAIDAAIDKAGVKS